MKTQIEHIKEAKRAYVLDLTLNKRTMNARFAIYVDDGTGLTVLWPSDCHESKQKDTLQYQKHSKNKQYPAFHFLLTGRNYSKFNSLKLMLQEINPDIEVFRIGSGHLPSSN